MEGAHRYSSQRSKWNYPENIRTMTFIGKQNERWFLKQQIYHLNDYIIITVL